MRARAAFVAVWLLVRVFGRLPTRALYALAAWTAAVAWRMSPRLRETTRDHMRQVLGPEASEDEVERAARGCARTSAWYWADLGRAAHLTQQQTLDANQSFDGLEHVFEARDRGRGVVMVSAHLGNPELLARAAGQVDLDVVALIEPLRDRRLAALIQSVRDRPGVRFLPANLHGVRATIAHLRAGGLVAIMADRDIQRRGRPTRFFDAEAGLPPGPAELALRTGAPVVAGFVYRVGPGRTRLRFTPELAFPRTGDLDADLPGAMAAIARALEDGIREAPDQWFVTRPVWPRAVEAGIGAPAAPPSTSTDG